MNERKELDDAQRAIHAGAFSDAVPVLTTLSDLETAVGGEAAFCLAVLYEVGSGVPQSTDNAVKYFGLAEARGYSPATYQLAGYGLRRDERDYALEKYRSIADCNPSAAYWAYRIIHEDPKLRRRDLEEEYFLDLAAKQGHILARKLLYARQIRGSKGLLRVPAGIFGFLSVYVAAFRAVRAGEKILYT